MSTYSGEKSIILDGYGESKQPDFTFSSGTEVSASCSLIWENEMFVFGGRTEVNQISKVENCRLSSVGQLTFRMEKGACTNFADELVFICFPEADNESTAQQCKKSSHPLGTFESAKDSAYPHKNTRISNDGGKLHKIDFLELTLNLRGWA